MGGAPIGPAETAALRGFAGQATLALEPADRRRDAEDPTSLVGRQEL
ncbi:hypothetical protein ACFCV9_08765 [Streptomyces sp. NPDC056367]